MVDVVARGDVLDITVVSEIGEQWSRQRAGQNRRDGRCHRRTNAVRAGLRPGTATHRPKDVPMLRLIITALTKMTAGNSNQ